MKSLKRRLDRLEKACQQKPLILVPQYEGMSEDEALHLRFGPEGPPEAVRLIIAANWLPPPGFPFEWGEWTDEDKAAAQGLSLDELDNLRPFGG